MSTQVPGSSYPTPYPGNSAGVGTFYPYPPYPSGVLSTLLDGLVSYWPLDEQSGVRYDAVGDNDLTDNNTVGAVNSGPNGVVAKLVAANGEYFDTGSTAVLDPSADFTLSAWMTHPTAGGGYGTVFAGSPSAQVLMQTPNTGAGTGVLDFRVLTGTPAIVNPVTVFDFTTPRHITVTWVAATKALEVFVDGVSAGTASGSGAAASATVLWIGKHHGGGLHEGTFSEYGVWSRVLTSGERASLFANGNGKKYEDLTTSEKVGLVSYWNLDEASGVRYDSHGSNHLTDNNTVGSVTNAGDAMDGAAASFVAASSESLSKSDVVLPDNYSVSLWMKLTAIPTDTYPTPFSVNTQGSNWPNECQLTLFAHPNTNLYAVVSDGSAGVQSQWFAPTFGQWYHLLLTFDTDKSLRMYLNNGDPLVATALAGTPYRAANPLGIGSGMGYSPTSSYFHGQIDEVAIWSRVLTEDERAELYAAGQGRFYPFPS